MKTLIIDASIYLRLLLPDEQKTAPTHILKSFRDEQIVLNAPSIIAYEVANGLRSAILSKRISKIRATTFLQSFLESPPQLHDFHLLAKSAFALANTYDLSIYDASYIALAQKEQLPFYTGDRRLAIKLKKLPSVFWVGEYKD